jgi:hypothetical protein
MEDMTAVTLAKTKLHAGIFGGFRLCQLFAL